MKWILMVLVLNDGEFHAHSPTFQEFDSILACVKAEKIVDQSYKKQPRVSMISVCVPKGDLK